MSKLKPYLFWIVCGVIVLVELVLLLFISPMSKDGQKSPGQVKDELDTRNKELEALFQKAKAGAPTRTFDAEIDNDIKELTSSWLATPAWKPVLDAHLAEYTSQIGRIHEYLVARSQHLHKQISGERGKFEWYSQYETATAELLQKLYDNQCLMLPKASSGAAVIPAGVTQPGMPQPEANTEPEAAPDFKKASAARLVGGFLTTTQYPESDRFNELTEQFRVMELIASALIEAKGTNEQSPVVPVLSPSEAHAQLKTTSWKDITDEAIVVQLTLNGPLSAVLAAEAALEENRDDSLPVKLVTGVTLSRKQFLSGERRDISSEPVELRVTLAVLDFTNVKEAVVVQEKKEPPPPTPKKQKQSAPDKTTAEEP